MLQAGAFGVLLALIWLGPKWLRESRDSQAKERERERASREREREADRLTRHELANTFQKAIADMYNETKANLRDERAGFEKRADRMVSAIDNQTAKLETKLDSVRQAVENSCQYPPNCDPKNK